MWSLKKEQGIPVYVQIIELILDKIKQGELLPGQRLPSERKLAAFFDVNRSTVVHALDELVALGWIVRKQGSGTLINEGKWGITPSPRTNWRRYLAQNVFAQVSPYEKKINHLLKENSSAIDLYTGELPLDLIPSFTFPPLTWQQFLAEEQQEDLGYLSLREAISEETKRQYAFELPPENLLITSGAQQALFLILQVLLATGDSVAIEDPSFLYALPIFQAAGIRLYGVKMDQEGIDLTSLEQMIRQHRVKMVMVNPTFQNPTGSTMSLQRRQQLIQLCQKYEVPILEDDVFGQLNFSKISPLPPLKKLDPENVLYIGSLSKLLGSTTKIGWLSAPSSINQQLAAARKMMDFSLSIFPQVLATLALTDSEFPEKVATLTKKLQTRGQLAYELFSDLPEWQVVKPQGGFYLWATWKAGFLRQKHFDYFLEEGLLIAPSFLFCEEKQSIRLNFSRINKKNYTEIKAKVVKVTKKLREVE